MIETLRRRERDFFRADTRNQGFLKEFQDLLAAAFRELNRVVFSFRSRGK